MTNFISQGGWAFTCDTLERPWLSGLLPNAEVATIDGDNDRSRCGAPMHWHS
jgi:hypothetical protein